MRTITGLTELFDAEGQELGHSEWHEVTQEDINTFADVTGDHQFIHVDIEKAKETPFGGTIAHGYYTLSLIPRFTEQVLTFEGFAFALNYGLDRVRFPSHMPVGGKVRASFKLAGVDDIAGGAQINTAATVENLGAAAYLGAAGGIKDKDILAAALAIHSVEARHAAALNKLVGRSFKGDGKLEGSLPNGAFAKGLSMDEVLEQVKPFIAS